MNSRRLSVTRRFWGGVATGTLLLGAAVVIGRPFLFGGAAAVFCWLLLRAWRFVAVVRRTRDTIDIDQRPVTDRATVDTPVPVTVSVELPDPAAAEVAVGIETPAAARAATDDPTVTLRAGTREATGETALVWDVAGSYRLAPPTTTLRDTGGLFVARVAVGNECAVTVDPPHVRRVNLGRTGRELVEDAERKSSTLVQSGVEPERIRKHVVGDSMRHIDWRSTARLGELHVREFEMERGRSAGLVIDASRSMEEGPEGRTKLDYVRHLALSVQEAAREQQLPIGLFVCDDVGPTVTIPARSDRAKTNIVRRRIHDLHPGPRGTGDGSSQGRHGLGRLRSRRSPLTAARVDRALDGDDSPFAARLHPFFARGKRPSRLGLVADDPLYETVTAFRAQQPGPTITCLFTDDSNRTTLAESLRAATHDGGEAVVFLTPSVLFDADVLSDPQLAYDRFVEFERFRRSIDALARVTVYELGPGDELAAVLAGSHRRRGQRHGRQPTDDEPTKPSSERARTAPATVATAEGEQ